MIEWIESALARQPVDELIWMIVGIFGQLMFASRWFVQWIVSERAKRSIVPVIFWFISIIGGTISLVYAIYLESVPFIMGQAGGLFVYFRNLWLIYRHAGRGEDIPIEDQAYLDENGERVEPARQ